MLPCRTMPHSLLALLVSVVASGVLLPALAADCSGRFSAGYRVLPLATADGLRPARPFNVVRRATILTPLQGNHCRCGPAPVIDHLPRRPVGHSVCCQKSCATEGTV